MKEDEIVSAVKRGAGIDTHEQAQRAVRATLRVLGQRLSGGETSDLASQLPPSLAEVLPTSGSGERFGVTEFYDRVADLEGQGCTVKQARQHARGVVAALKASVTGGEFDDVMSQLPAEYDDLLGTSPAYH